MPNCEFCSKRRKLVFNYNTQDVCAKCLFTYLVHLESENEALEVENSNLNRLISKKAKEVLVGKD